jgi:hypothetical protein
VSQVARSCTAPAGPDVNSRGRQPTVDRAQASPALKGPNGSRPLASPRFDPAGVAPVFPTADRELAPTAIHLAARRAASASQPARQRFGLRQPSRAFAAASAPPAPRKDGGRPPHSKTLPCHWPPPPRYSRLGSLRYAAPAPTQAVVGIARQRSGLRWQSEAATPLSVRRSASPKRRGASLPAALQNVPAPIYSLAQASVSALNSPPPSRPSGFGFVSDIGFRTSDFPSPHHDH